MTKTGDLTKDFGLKDQLQRAAVSVMTNVAEGFERTGSAEKLHFYNIARSSNGEIRSLLYIVEDNFPESPDAARNMRIQNISCGRIITGLISSYKRRQAFIPIKIMFLLTTTCILYLRLT